MSDEEDLSASGENGAGTDIRAVSRAAQILGLFSPAQPDVSATAVARQLNMNRTTAYRYCMSLTAANLLERLENGHFAPGMILLQLGAFALGRRNVLAAAPRHMRSLSAATEATAVLSLWGSTGPIVSAVAEDPQESALVTVRVGTHLTMSASQAKIFYTFHPDQLYMQRLLANLPRDSLEELMGEVDEIRRTGFVSSVNPRGIAILAVPVFDSSGLCAALALLSTREALDINSESAELRVLRNTARELSAEMGATDLPVPN